MRLLTLSLLCAIGCPAAAVAQAVVQPLPGSSDADLLATTMRRVAANPLDVDALVTAGEQSLRVDDLSGAASLFARAEKIDPRNGRVKAGMASILLRSERPGEALRYFGQAEAAGLDPRRFAADRGLAYDLTGQQEHAQRDYRLALAGGADDETTRRYALSLGISGRREEALKLLEPLVGRTDRAAWRARAFVLAMAGDQTEAARIAGTMMPGAMSQGLLPFFQRLPSLSAVDRAFAVHFGEVRATPERLADARLAPPVSPLPPSPRPVQVAAVAPQPTATGREDRRTRRRRGRDRDGEVRLAAGRTPLPAAAAVVSQPADAQATSVAGAAGRPSLAGVTTQVASVIRAPVGSAALPVSAGTAGAGGLAPLLPASAVPAPLITIASAAPPTLSPPPGTLAVAATDSVAAAPSGPGTALAAVSRERTLPIVATPRATRPVTPVNPRAGADAVLARIVASLSIPAAELGVSEPARPRPVTTGEEGGARTEAAVRAKIERDAALDQAARRIAAPVTPPPLTAAERRAAAAKALANRKAAEAKKAAAVKKVAEEKEAAEARKLVRSHPSRIWVQVAGGAFAGDLPKAWAATKAKAPQVFGSRAGYSAKLRATNRVVTGPFKTDAEARAFINQLAKAGVSAFPFTSDPGEPVSRLPSR